MKSKFLCLFGIAALLLSCSNDESTNNVGNSKENTKTIMSREELEAPFKSFSYSQIDADTYEFSYEVPENYSQNITIENDEYFVNLTSEKEDSESFTNHTIELDMIDGVLSLNFNVNGRAIRKPKGSFEL